MTLRSWVRKLFTQNTRPVVPRPSARHRARPGLEVLEDRTVPATLTVSSIADNTSADSVLTLREAVLLVNAGGNATAALGRSLTNGERPQVQGTFGKTDTINFSTLLTAGGPATIKLGIDGDDTFGPSALPVSTALSIVGPASGNGVTIARDTAAAPHRLRLFYVTSTGSLTLKNLTISDGLARGGSSDFGGGGAGLGGAVVNAGTLTLLNSTLTGNQAIGGSAGVYSDDYSTVLGGAGLGGDAPPGGDGGPPNGGSQVHYPVPEVPAGFGGGGDAGSAGGFGGGGGIGQAGGFGGGAGAPPEGGGPLAGFGGNTGVSGRFYHFPGLDSAAGGAGGGLGGAVFNFGGTLNVINSTLTGNTARGGTDNTGGASGYGGAVFNLNGNVTVTNSTLAANVVSTGGGAIYNLGDNLDTSTQNGPALPHTTATVHLFNSILAGSTNGSALVSDFVTGTYNPFGVPLGAAQGTQSTGGNHNLIQTGAANFVGTSTLTGDPMLGPLGNYGGSTRTLSLLPGSPGIDAAATLTTTPTIDQRGVVRPQFGAPDLGAFESQGFRMNVTSGSPQSVPISTAFPQALKVTVTPVDGLDPVAGGLLRFTAPSTLASATLSSTGLLTLGSDGKASVTATANSLAGRYNVAADTAGAVAPGNFTLTNTASTATTAGGGVAITFSNNEQSVTLTAKVTSTAGTVNQGKVAFSILVGGQPASTDAAVANGQASVTFKVPAATRAGVYTIEATYADNTGVFTSSSDTSQVLTVSPAATTTTSGSATATYSSDIQNLTLSASVSSTAGTVNQGSVTFTLLQGSTVIGTATTSGKVSNGQASVTYALPSGTPAGSYTVSAVYNPDNDFAGSSDATHTVTVGKASPAFGGLVSPSIVYGTATTVLSGHLSDGASVPTGNVSITLGGVTQTALLDVGGDFSTTFATASLAVNGSPYTVAYSYAGDANFISTSGSSSLTVIQATPTVTWAAPAGIVYGTPLSATQLDATADVPGAFAYSPAPGAVLDAGSHTLSVTFTPADQGNYKPATASVTLVVTQASPTVTVTGAFTYDANEHGATVTVTGAGGASPAGALRITYNGSTSLPVNAGRYSVIANFLSNDPNYSNALGGGTLVINPATPTITWAAPGHIVYGTPLGATQLDATADVPGAFSYSQPAGAVLGAGSHTLSVTFTPTDGTNYNSVTREVTLTVDRATPTVTWAAPDGITYGAPLGAAQLDATADVPGAFAYSPALGTVLGAGSHTLSVTFTPTDAANYESVTASVTLTVDRATPTVSWAAPGHIVYGTPLGAAQLDATADVPGAFAYGPDLGAVLGAGSHTLSVTFTPADGDNYNSVTREVTLTVDRATLLVTADASRPYGVANPDFTPSYSGFVNGETLATGGVTGSPNLASDATPQSVPGDYAISVGAGSLAAANYLFTFVDGTLTVTPAPLSAAGVGVSASAGARFQGSVATFTNPDPFGGIASYTAVIAWGDGSTSAGVITGTGDALTVSGAHTYARPGAYPVGVTISHDLGFTTAATTTGTATISPRNAPSLLLTGDPLRPLMLSLRSFHAGAAPVHSWVISWGDGTVQKVAGDPAAVSHRYALRTKRYAVTATANYQDGTWSAYAAGVRMAFRDPSAGYVANVFYALTGVAIDAARLRQWAGVLRRAAGLAGSQAARSVVTGLMRMSAEYRARLVRGLYRQVMHRDPTRAELRWAASLFHTLPLMASDFSDGGWAGVKPLILKRITRGR